MTTFQGLCPHCGEVGGWQYDTVSITSFPPTGGDYTWAELDAPTRCPHCAEVIRARVRADIDDSRVDRLVSSPMPTLPALTQYVVAWVRRFAEDMVQVRIIQFAATEAEAQAKLKAEGGAINSGYESRLVLRLTAEGYHRLNGKRLHESAHQQVEYA